MNKKILVVEDNQVTSNFIVTTLERAGHEVIAANDGLTALDILTSFTPDIMFIDLIMPKIGGEKLCRIIRKMEHLNECFIVILSGAVVEMDLDYDQIGANACIAKGPFNKMAEHIMTAVAQSETGAKDHPPESIMGVSRPDEMVYARQMTKELLSRNRHLEIILESIAEGILEIYSGKIVYANSTAISIIGLPYEKIIGSPLLDLFGAPVNEQLKEFLKSENKLPLEIGSNHPFEYRDKMISIKILPVISDPPTTIVMLQDVTHRNQLLMRLQHVQKMEAIGTIASGVAHNFRNILAGILNNSEVLSMNYQDVEGLNEITGRINSSVKSGSHMVERLLQFSHKRIKNEFKPVDLNEVINETCLIIQKTFTRNIDIQIDSTNPLLIMGDASSISQVVMNICTNARDAMPNGGVLSIQTGTENSKAIMTIKDTGTGMDAKTLHKCYDPFFTTKTIGRGTGLGLSITYTIVRNHNGEIQAESEVGKGTTFKIYLPLADQ